METEVRKLFDQYAESFNQALTGNLDMDAVASAYAQVFIGASPVGIVTGKNDDQLKEVMERSYAYYRSIGTKEMRKRGVRISPIDQYHCIAHVAWTAVYARAGRPDTAIDFDVHYLVQMLDSDPKVFGWISGDEQAVLKKHGII